MACMLRYVIRPIVAELISLDAALRLNYCFPNGLFLIFFIVLQPFFGRSDHFFFASFKPIELKFAHIDLWVVRQSNIF